MKSMIASFPTARARRLRRTDALRALARENGGLFDSTNGCYYFHRFSGLPNPG